MSAALSVGVLDYGVGNIQSVQSAVRNVGGDPIVSCDPEKLLRCERLILPGIGAFAHGIEEFRARGLDRVVDRSLQAGIPLLGICLGMQMLSERSLEFGDTPGLGLTAGTVTLLERSDAGNTLRLPHVGWKPLKRVPGALDWLFEGIEPQARFYFIHSFALRDASADITAWAEYGGVDFAAIVARGNVVGTQFHPEKSGPAGLRMLSNFLSKGHRVYAGN